MPRGRPGIASICLPLLCPLFACLPGSATRRALELVPSRPNAPAVLVFMPDSPSAKEVLRGLIDELSDELAIDARFVGAVSGPEVFAAAIEEARPRAIVLMNNPIVRGYRRYQLATPSAARIPVVVLLTSFLRQSTVGLENYTGIHYEVPLITSLVNLRDLLAQPVERVGVIHRASFSEFLDEQQALAHTEGFSLVRVEVGETGVSPIRRAVERLRTSEKVDAIWILNDNVLLEPRAVRRGWLPALRDNRTPILVNAGSLLSRTISFGTFAVLPDHRALGAQGAALLTAVAERGWRAAGIDLEYPLTVEKVLDVGFARSRLELREQRLATVDRLVE